MRLKKNGLATKVFRGFLLGCVLSAGTLLAPVGAQAQEVVVFSDDFQNNPGDRWRSGGLQNAWEFIFEGTNRVLADSPTREYEIGTDSYIAIYNPVNLSGQPNCRVLFNLRLDLEADKDFLKTEASTDGQGFVPISQLTGDTGGAFQAQDKNLGTYAGQPQVWIRFHLTADNVDTNDTGAEIDDVRIVCGAAATPTPSPSESVSSTPTAVPAPSPTASQSPTPTPTAGTCTSGNPCATNTTGSVKSVRGGKLRISGGVTPAVPGGKVLVILFRKKDGKFRKVASKTDELNTESRFSVTMNRPAPGRCKVIASFLGDAGHQASAAGTKFNC